MDTVEQRVKKEDKGRGLLVGFFPWAFPLILHLEHASEKSSLSQTASSLLLQALVIRAADQLQNVYVSASIHEIRIWVVSKAGAFPDDERPEATLLVHPKLL